MCIRYLELEVTTAWPSVVGVIVYSMLYEENKGFLYFRFLLSAIQRIVSHYTEQTKSRL